jgi:hypothetical protein
VHHRVCASHRSHISSNGLYFLLLHVSHSPSPILSHPSLDCFLFVCVCEGVVCLCLGFWEVCPLSFPFFLSSLRRKSSHPSRGEGGEEWGGSTRYEVLCSSRLLVILKH